MTQIESRKEGKDLRLEQLKAHQEEYRERYLSKTRLHKRLTISFDREEAREYERKKEAHDKLQEKKVPLASKEWKADIRDFRREHNKILEEREEKFKS